MKQVKSRYCKEARYMSFSCKISGSSHEHDYNLKTIERKKSEIYE